MFFQILLFSGFHFAVHSSHLYFLSISPPCHLLLHFLIPILPFFALISKRREIRFMRSTHQKNSLPRQVFQIRAILYCTEANNWWRVPFCVHPAPFTQTPVWYTMVWYKLTLLTSVTTWWDKSATCWTCHSVINWNPLICSLKNKLLSWNGCGSYWFFVLTDTRWVALRAFGRIDLTFILKENSAPLYRNLDFVFVVLAIISISSINVFIALTSEIWKHANVKTTFSQCVPVHLVDLETCSWL